MIEASESTGKQALEHKRYETARRIALSLLETPQGDRYAQLQLLHEACRNLGDPAAARAALEQIQPADDGQRLEVSLLLAEDYYILATVGAHYRVSAEAAVGLTIDEYQLKMTNLMADLFERCLPLAKTDAQRREVAAVLSRCGRQEQAAKLTGAQAQAVPSSPPETIRGAWGSVAGTVRWPEGGPAAGIALVLGLAMKVSEPDPALYLDFSLGFRPQIGRQESLTTCTDERGRFLFQSVPAGRHEFLAARLDGQQHDIATRFLAQGIVVNEGKTTELDIALTSWTSAPRHEVCNPLPQQLTRGAVAYRLVHQQAIANPFYFDFPRQLMRIALPLDTPADERRLLLLSSAAPQTPLPFQLSRGEVIFFADLPQLSDRVWALYSTDDTAAAVAAPVPQLRPEVAADGKSADIDTGRACFRIAWGEGEGGGDRPPLMAVRGEDGRWRGQGRLTLPPGLKVMRHRTDIVECGPLSLSVKIAYELSNGAAYAITFTAHRDEPYLLARETSADVEGAAFEFSLKDFSGGRGFLHWTPEQGDMHWTSLKAEDRELARLQESVAWWIPPQGFGYAVMADGLQEKDYVGVFTLRRGEWIDRKFQALAQGPGDENRELDWPFPEMVGSTISMITAHTNVGGDVFFRFSMFDGERQWGIIVSTLDRNDGSFKEISAVQHKNSSPRLQDFKDWRLDEQDHAPRPSVVARRQDLKNLRKKKDSPVFARYWQLIADGKAQGAVTGVAFAVDGDPVIAWRKKRELMSVAKIYSKMTLLGRDYADIYSPVGGRAITQWVEDYDLIAASGIFTPNEERLVRQFFMLMGHMYMAGDFMNWRYGSRNPNFEADRTDIIGAIGLAFHGNPDTAIFLTHVVDLMRRSLEVYCTPDSGKWYENPACYYLHGSKCRMNLAFHLSRHGISDPTTIPRLKDYLRWGILLLTPSCLSSYDAMRDGCDADTYRRSLKVRRIAPVGDHAHIGPWVPEHYALMSKLYRKSDPAFADLLLWAYQVGGCGGGYFGNIPLLFAALDEEDLGAAPAAELTSRRLQGFGATFRGRFGQEDEFYLLFKQGPGGYRYHRTEGSIILFADGKPLIYDGGEAGETWRHTTLSFYDVHMPLAAGHVERFHSFGGVDFCQGVHPEVIKPGNPIFLNDLCDHKYVDVAYTRFNEPRPANSRSVVWIKDEYVLLHDELDIDPTIPSFWHLQAVADSHTGDAAGGYLFKGRFGTDLQVLLPGQEFDQEKVEQLPTLEYQQTPDRCFSMRHLMLKGRRRDGYLAVLRPLGASRAPLQATLVENDRRMVGVHVTGDGVNDHVLLRRGGTQYNEADLRFEGAYGAAIRRPNRTELLLVGPGSIQAAYLSLTSDGPAAHLRVSDEGAEFTVEGSGTATVLGMGKPITLSVYGGRAVCNLSHRGAQHKGGDGDVGGWGRS